MKVMFVSINKLKSYRPVLPIGMVTVATQLQVLGHPVRCVDLMFEVDDEQAVKTNLREFLPDVVGISIRNVDSLNLLEPAIYTPLALEVADWCREVCPGVKILLGGAGFTTVPEDLMDFIGADYGLTGFAEQSIVQLIECLEGCREPREVSGVIFPADNGYYKKPPSFSMNYQNVYPVDHKLYDPRYSTYRFETHDEVSSIPATIQTKKGCVLECIFCSNFLVDGTGVLTRRATDVADEVEQMIGHGVKSLEVVDGVFNLPLHHALDVLREFKRRGLRLPWSCMINPGAVSPELVRLLAETGCREVQLGTDSCSDRVLAILKKNFRKRQVFEAHRLFHEAGLRVMHCLFIGAPGDDRESVRETLNAMEEMVPNGSANSRVYWTFGLRICRGTELHRMAVREHLLNGKERFLIPKYYVSRPILENDDFLEEIRRRMLANENWYLWWGLESISLRQRIDMAIRENHLTEQVVLAAMERKRQPFVGIAKAAGPWMS
jgi:radical SAM superfamily enzyme YgiQ (UPF0313 family)